MIAINEIFGPTIQGEGKSAGKEVLFVRLSGCNLACIWCDTPYTWNWKGTKFQHPDKYDPRKETRKMKPHEVVDELRRLSPSTQAVVISGGEPFLQQEQLIPLLVSLRYHGYWVEIETNGTLPPFDGILSLVDQINCSPKLENSGPDNPAEKRINREALNYLAINPRTTFKFVVSSEMDITEIVNLVTRFNLRNVYLMAEGRTKEEQLQRAEQTKALCERFGYTYSQRLHVLQWGTKRGV